MKSERVSPFRLEENYQSGSLTSRSTKTWRSSDFNLRLSEQEKYIKEGNEDSLENLKLGSKKRSQLEHQRQLKMKKYEEENVKERVNIAFNSIRDLNDKLQIHNAIKNLESKEERTKLIDKILLRKQEKRNADEIVKLVKVQPLLSRFMKKLKRGNTELLQSSVSLKNENESSEQKDNSSIQKNELHEKVKQKMQQIDNEKQSPVEPKSGGIFDKKAKVLSIFFGSKPKNDSQDQRKKGLINQISSYNENTPNNGNGRKINFKKVSENSSELIQKGREKQRQHATELLKEVQRESLASHFKSYSLKNRYDFANSAHQSYNNSIDIQQLNTFQLDGPGDQELIKKQREKMNSFANYQNSIVATKIVSHDILNFIDKFSHLENQFVLAPKTLKEAKSRSIENAIQNTLQDQSPNLKKLSSKRSLNIYTQIQPTISQTPQVARFKHQGSSTTRKNRNIGLFSPQESPVLNLDSNNFTDMATLIQKQGSPNPSRKTSINMQIASSPHSPSFILSANVSGTKQQIEMNQSKQKDKTGVPQTKHFSRSSQQFFTKDQQVNELESLSSARQLQIQQYQLFLDKKQISKDSINESPRKLIDYMHTLENNEQIKHKVKKIITFDKWKLEGPIHHSGQTQSLLQQSQGQQQQKSQQFRRYNLKNIELNDECKDDESLVSFTEIKLDKLYKETRELQNQQRIIERTQSRLLSSGQKSKADSYGNTFEKHQNTLLQVKNDILHTTQAKFKQRRKASTPL